jgi:putative transposase
LASSTYYYRPKTTALEPQRRDAELRDQIESIQTEFPGYGHRRLHQELKHRGHTINKKRIRRVMAENGLRPILWRSFVRTTDSNHPHRVYPNLLKHQTLTGSNQAWAADITYIRAAFVYLAAILDLYTRQIIGWAISKRIDGELCLAALQMALNDVRPWSAAFTIPIVACNMPATIMCSCSKIEALPSVCRPKPIHTTTRSSNHSSNHLKPRRFTYRTMKPLTM